MPGEEILRLFFRGLIPIVLLLGGVAILFLRMPGWSLIIGMPLTIIGTVFLIYTYDEVVRRNLGEFPSKNQKGTLEE